MRVDEIIIVEAVNDKEAIRKAILESGYEGKSSVEYEWEVCRGETAFFQL